jgi:hypothetical protein
VLLRSRPFGRAGLFMGQAYFNFRLSAINCRAIQSSAPSSLLILTRGQHRRLHKGCTIWLRGCDLRPVLGLWRRSNLRSLFPNLHIPGQNGGVKQSTEHGGRSEFTAGSGSAYPSKFYVGAKNGICKLVRTTRIRHSDQYWPVLLLNQPREQLIHVLNA